MIVLITFFPWDSATGGGCIIRHYVERLTSERIHWISLSRPSGFVELRASHVTKEFVAAPARGNVRLRLGGFWRWYYRWFWYARAAARIERRLDELNARVTWIVADYTLGPVGLRLLPKLKNRRVHLSLHDHPLAAAEREHYGPEDLREIAAFERGLDALEPSVDGISEELIEAVVPRATRKSVIALPAVPAASAKTVLPPRATGPLRVGLSGNFFGQAELTCFQEGLERWSQRSGRDWRLVVFGRSPADGLDRRIEARGYKPVEEVRGGLAECDLLLLPVPVDSLQMQTSVPTKLTTYLEIGRLILTFAPRRSVTERLVFENSLGPVITQLDPETVAGQLERLTTWDMAAANAGRQRLLAQRFNERRMLGDLGRLLSG